MSAQSIPEKQVYTYSDFQTNFVKIYKEKGKLKKNGIVFIGNSRIGKSTLSCILANIKMKAEKNSIGQVCLEPVDPNYKQAVKHTKKSVTQIPNVYDYILDNEQYSIVDLPGFLDTSYFRQICNLHYIKTILNSLEKICFVMVIQVHSKQKKLVEKELKMMDRFYSMFPEAASNTVIVVNNLNSNVDQNQKNKIFQNILKQVGESDISKDAAKKKFYVQILKNSKFQYVKKINLESEQVTQQSIQNMHVQMQKFIKNNKKHMKQMAQIKYQIKFDDLQTQTKKIKVLLQDIVRKSAKNIEQSIKVLIKSYQLSVDCYDKKQKIQQFKIQTILKDFIQQKKADFQYNILQKINSEILTQIFHKKGNKLQLINQSLQAEDSLFEIFNELWDYINGDDIMDKVLNKLKILVYRLSLVLSQCKKELSTIILYIIGKSQELQFLKKSIEDFSIQQQNCPDSFYKLILEVKHDLPLTLKDIQKSILQKILRIADKSLNKLQNYPLSVSGNGNFQERRTKINILNKYSRNSGDKKLQQRLQIVYFKLFLQEIILIDISHQTDEIQQKIFQRNVNGISEYLLQSKITQKKGVVQKWRKQDKKNNKILKTLQLKVYQKFSQYFKIHQNYNYALQCYQNLRGYHEEIFDLIMNKWSSRNLDQKYIKYQKLIEASQKMLQSCRFDLALKAYNECSKLVRNEYDQESIQKYRKSQNKIIEHYKNMSNTNQKNIQSYSVYLKNYENKIAKQYEDLSQIVSQNEFLDKLQKVQKIVQIVSDKRSVKSSPQKDHQNKNFESNIMNLASSCKYTFEQKNNEVQIIKLNKKTTQVQMKKTQKQISSNEKQLNEKKDLREKQKKKEQKQGQQSYISSNLKNFFQKTTIPAATQKNTKKTFDFSKFGKS